MRFVTDGFARASFRMLTADMTEVISEIRSEYRIMEKIQRMTQSQRYEVLDLWLRSTTCDNSFLEANFWEKHYEKIKNDYLTTPDTFVYIVDGVIAGFICITNDNFIKGLFVDPKYRGQGIGTKLISFAKESFSILHVNVYTKNRAMIDFATHMGFIIDGARLHSSTGEIQYRMIWNENNM